MNTTEMADITYRELNQPNDESISSIAFYYQSNLGLINNLLSTNFTLDNTTLNIIPELTDAQFVIYKFLFIISYFNKQIQKNLGAGAYSSSILEIREDGRVIKKIDKTNIAKQLTALVASIKIQLNDNIYAYNSNNALPYQIDVSNPIIREAFLFGWDYGSRWWKMRI